MSDDKVVTSYVPRRTWFCYFFLLLLLFFSFFFFFLPFFYAGVMKLQISEKFSRGEVCVGRNQDLLIYFGFLKFSSQRFLFLCGDSFTLREQQKQNEGNTEEQQKRRLRKWIRRYDGKDAKKKKIEKIWKVVRRDLRTKNRRWGKNREKNM